MTTNLLVNGDLQANWAAESSHQALANFDGTEWMLVDPGFGNIFNPPAWTTWFKWRKNADGTMKFAQPEVVDAWAKNDADRALAGMAKGVKVFCSFKPLLCGMYQYVTGITVGTKLRLRAWAHGWTNHDGWEHAGDGNWCLGSLVKDYKIALTETEAASLVGVGEEGSLERTRNDANIAAKFKIGYGTALDPYAATYCEPRYIYNGYCYELVLEFTAPASGFYVFTRQELCWSFRNNDGYWGGVVLEKVEDSEPEPEPEPEPENGDPRIDYARTVSVIPAGATDEQALAIFEEAWARSRETVGGSYDDAGIGKLSSKTANLYGIPADQQQTFRDWYAQYYPGTAVNFLDVPGNAPNPSLLRLAYPTTYEPATITQEFGGAHGGIDLKSSYRLWGSEALAALPGTVIEAAWVYDTLGNNVVVRTTLADGRTVDCRYAHLLADLYVKVGDKVALSRKLGKCDGSASPPVADHLHFSVCVDGTYVDPAPLIDWPDAEPEPEPEPEPVVTFNPRSLSLHLQTMVAGAQEYVRDCKPSCVKRVQGAQDLITLHNLNPSTLCVYRAYPESGTPVEHVSNNLATLQQVCDAGVELYFEGPNEVYGSDRTSNTNWRNWELEFIQRLAAAEPRCKPVVFCAAVGNPPEDQYDLLVSLAQAATAAGGLMGYHGYWGTNPTWCSLDDYQTHGCWLQYRWEMMDDYLTARGVYPRWFLGETGAVEGTPLTTGDYQFGPFNGWLSSTCLGGDWMRYLAQVEQFAQHIYDWNLTHGGRCVGGTLFTSGQGTGWEWFQIQAEQMAAVRNMLLGKWPL